MPMSRWLQGARPVCGAPGLRAIDVERPAWRDVAQDVVAAGGRLLALWGSGVSGEPRTMRMIVLMQTSSALVVTARTVRDVAAFPGIEDLFPAASRMQRAARDLSGIETTDADQRPWLRHTAWHRDTSPLAMRQLPAPVPDPVDDYQFIRVEGDGVHEIAVGPVHAGIIEPGHFRFSVVGEKVLRLEERLGYVHKGIERRFTELPILEGHRLAARVSGDSAVAYAWAYCQALEAMAGTVIPARAAWLRALALELERIANHLGDIGALGNDAGFAFGLSQFMRLKESLLRATGQALGQRYLNEYVVPGGVRSPLTTAGIAVLATCVDSLA